MDSFGKTRHLKLGRLSLYHKQKKSPEFSKNFVERETRLSHNGFLWKNSPPKAWKVLALP
jgi:hypothetical protein